MHAPNFTDISTLLGELNKKILTWDSLQGIIILGLCAFLIFKLSNEIRKMIIWLIFFVLFMEIGHACANTVLGEHLPFLKQIFKFQFIQAIAQLFRGTVICDGLLYFQKFLNETIGQLCQVVWVWVTEILPKLCKWLWGIITNLDKL